MLIVNNRRYFKKNVVGGGGIMDAIKNFLRRMAATNASRSSLHLLRKAAASEIGREAITAAKFAGKELASSAISTAKDVAIDKGKKALEKVYAKTGTVNPNQLLTTIVNEAAKDDPYINPMEELHKKMFGSSIQVKKKMTKKNAARIQDLVKMGSGLLIA